MHGMAASPKASRPTTGPSGSAPPPPDGYDAATAYSELLAAVTARANREAGHADAYQQLMAKEQRVLDTIDRVVNEREVSARHASSILGMGLAQHGSRLVAVMRSLLDDLTAAQTVQDAIRAVWQEDRRLYLGVALVALALVCLLLEHA